MILGALWFWIQSDSSQEDAAPDHFELGTVYVGSKVEFSSKFLTTNRKHSFDAFYERMVGAMPKSWQPTFMGWHPAVLRAKSFVPVDLSTLKPAGSAPAFIKVLQISPVQDKYQFKGLPSVFAELEVDTSRPGDYSGLVTVTMGRRQASLPVHVIVREKTEGIPRLLVASTPYQAYSTEHGSELHAVARLISSSGMAADYLNGLPAQIENYRTIILADSTLSGISAADVGRVRSYVEQGGRLILPCNYFFRGTVSSANLILAGHGLQVVDLDIQGRVSVTNLVSDVITRGVARLEFHRPSPIKVTDASQGKLLALDPAGQGGFVGVARLPGGGEIVVVASSLWWNWLGQFKDGSNNERLMQNVLRSPGSQ